MRRGIGTSQPDGSTLGALDLETNVSMTFSTSRFAFRMSFTTVVRVIASPLNWMLHDHRWARVCVIQWDNASIYNVTDLVDTNCEKALYRFIISRKMRPICLEKEGPTDLHTRSLIFNTRVNSLITVGFFRVSRFSEAAFTILRGRRGREWNTTAYKHRLQAHAHLAQVMFGSVMSISVRCSLAFGSGCADTIWPAAS